METKTGKQIVSKGAYASLVSKTLVWVVSSIGLYFLCVLCVILAPLIILSSLLFPYDMTRTDWIVNIFTAIGLCLICYGFTRLARKGLSNSQQLARVVPLTRANTAGLPAPDSLVRASSESPQEQQAVLLRAAQAGQETPPEQLVRAVNRQE